MDSMLYFVFFLFSSLMDFNQIWHKAVPLSINALLVTLYFNGLV